MGRKRRYMSWLAGLLAVALAAAACNTSGGAGAATSDEESPAAQIGGSGREVIRFTFAPDPVWDYLKDTGELAQWEEDNNLRIVTTESWDEYGEFAGGQGHIVSTSTHELPGLEEEAGVELVAFGKYNHERVPLIRNAGDGYETLEDVPAGSTTCANSAVSNTIAWSVIADQLHGIDYRVGEGRFNIAVHDHFAMPEMVTNGECTIAAPIPEAAAPLLRTGELEMMYGGKAPWQLYQDICECDHKGIMSNLFVARQDWYNSHSEEVAAFLQLWEHGLELWRDNKREIVSLYLQHFAVETEEDIDWMIDFMEREEGEADWFTDTVYMDQAWIDEEVKFYDLMKESGWMNRDAEIPQFEALTPPS